MARRKIRPLGVIAFCTVLLLFQLLRKGGKEVFTFDTLPEYTDTEGYVKKPVPQGVQVSLPPPPPADWTRPGELHVVDEDHPARGNEPNVRPRPPPIQPPRQNPARPAQQRPNEGSEERTAFADSHSTDSLHDVVDHIDSDEKQPLATSPESHFTEEVHVPDQPPVSGDVHAGTRHSPRPLYTQEELGPRIENYPLSPNDIIRLPKLKPVTMPKVQARYPSESADHKRIRLQRQAAIKRAMTRSWETYSTYAMGHDEVRPVSAHHHDPFCGWGATLVDSLDTLQIMGMQTEYEEALKFVETIDFAHTTSYSIPLFETVIRYLGGLLGAFDMSNGRDTILLDKAKELGDMLMGSFDTINRMPLLRYNWRPRAARQNLQAGADACLAELGTLTMEFTRLAQLTGNHSYFDAVLPW
jgi:mannosyl-oligosaccharide alpha-1,2-mannosidase